MIKRKNVLAENMLRFGPKNLTKSQVAALRRLIEQQTTETVKYKNPTDIDGFFNKTVNNAMPLAPNDAETVIFATTLKPSVSEFGAESGETYCIKLSSGASNQFIAVGQIGTVNDVVNPVVNDGKAGAILFFAIPAAAGTSSNRKSGQIGVQPKFIPYAVNTGDPLNGLAKFASDIIKAIAPAGAGKRLDTLDDIAPQIAAVFKAAVGVGIADANQLDTQYAYKQWIQEIHDALAS